jgi:hypothetical protein
MTTPAPHPAKSHIGPLIRTVRGQQVILDADLALLYGVPTKRLNEQFRRNRERFPEDFAFQLTPAEAAALRSQPVTSTPTVNPSQIATASADHSLMRSQIATASKRNIRHCPRAFTTEHGALMAATGLNSPQAVNMSLFIIRAFVKMREDLAANAAILKRLAEIDRTLLGHDTALRDIYHKLRPLLAPPPALPKKEIGFHAVK